MIDLAKRDGLEIDPARLSELLGVAVIPTVAVRRRGPDALADALDTALAAPPPEPAGLSEASPVAEADAHDPPNLPPIPRERTARAATAPLSESGSRRRGHAAHKGAPPHLRRRDGGGRV